VLTVLCSDETIKNIASRKPTNIGMLRGIRGMGPTRCKTYGDDIIRMVNQSKVPPTQPVRVKHPATPVPTYPIKHAVGQTNPIIRQMASPPPSRAPFRGIEPNTQGNVYILELAGGRVYVGKSRCSAGSAAHVQHRRSLHPRVQAHGERARLGKRARGDAAERDETLRYMFLAASRTFVAGDTRLSIFVK